VGIQKVGAKKMISAGSEPSALEQFQEQKLTFWPVFLNMNNIQFCSWLSKKNLRNVNFKESTLTQKNIDDFRHRQLLEQI
jgi:hypothetical protein